MVWSNTPLVLVILDGWGVSQQQTGNAIARAKKTNIDRLMADYPSTTLLSSGENVGLPEGQMGNSEVGHLNLGAGRVVYQDLSRISKAIKDGSFYNNPVFLSAIEHIQEKGSALHLMGLLSDGGVHSHIDHLYGLLELARDQGVKEVFIHVFLDGRDVLPDNALEYIVPLEDKLKKIELGAVATVMGRYYAMDRDKRWNRIELAYRAMVLGEGVEAASSREAVEKGYLRGETDEFIKPTVIMDKNGKPVAKISNDDAIIFYNFRPDRARQITRAFVDDDFEGFERPAGYPRVYFVCMTQYAKSIEAPVAYKPQVLINTLGEVLSYHNLKQLRLAETEKYAHVTFFFNGGVEQPNSGEDRILIPSPKVATYDLKPEMSALEVTNEFLKQLDKDKYDVIIVNFANTDMVGHTCMMDAAVCAVEVVDRCLGRVVEATLQKKGTVLITADHGNAEVMETETGEPFSAHTVNPVPFIMVSPKGNNFKLCPGKLEDVAPTILDLLGIPKPGEMTGQSLIVK